MLSRILKQIIININRQPFIIVFITISLAAYLVFLSSITLFNVLDYKKKAIKSIELSRQELMTKLDEQAYFPQVINENVASTEHKSLNNADVGIFLQSNIKEYPKEFIGILFLAMSGVLMFGNIIINKFIKLIQGLPLTSSNKRLHKQCQKILNKLVELERLYIINSYNNIYEFKDK